MTHGHESATGYGFCNETSHYYESNSWSFCEILFNEIHQYQDPKYFTHLHWRTPLDVNFPQLIKKYE
jgi:hypothetical protein